MNNGESTQDPFEKLLRWLDPDRDTAGQKYRKIHRRLIIIFSCRGYCKAEDLADDTVDVLVSKIDWLIANYQGDPALYFYGVAKKIMPKKKPPPRPPPPPDTDEIERKCSCLDRCLEEQLTEAESRLVLRYHEKNKREKIEVRKQLARELGISLNALRIRVYHIQSRLRPCIDQCLKNLLNE
jgi:hypothetical protein